MLARSSYNAAARSVSLAVSLATVACVGVACAPGGPDAGLPDARSGPAGSTHAGSSGAAGGGALEAGGAELVDDSFVDVEGEAASNGTDAREWILGTEDLVPSEAQILSELTPLESVAFEEARAYAETNEDGTVLFSDMRFSSLEHLDALMSNPGDREVDKGFYSPSRLWSNTNLDVCWTTRAGTGSTQAQRDRIRALVEQTWEAVADVNFRDWGVCNGGEEITIRHAGNARGSSNVGTDSGGNNPSMTLPSSGTVAWQESTAIHEFGHALGMVHEFLRSEYLTQANGNPANAWNCPNADNNIAPVAAGGLGEVAFGDEIVVGGYDQLSIMNYCTSNTLVLTDTDITTVQQMYGPSDWRYEVLMDGWNRGTTVRMSVRNTTTNRTQNRDVSVSTSSKLVTATTAEGEPHRMGDGWSLSATPTDSTWSCNGSSGTTPAGGFADAPMTLSCYRPAEVMVALR